MFKMKFDLYEAISHLCVMLDLLEDECRQRDKDKPATELFIRINGLKRASKKLEAESKRLIRCADIDRYGPLSKSKPHNLETS